MATLQKERGVAFLGTMGWSYPFWIGKFYPEGTRPSNYLLEYARRFNSVEIDATFYRIPSQGTVEGWRESVPNEFKFAAKFPRSVTHSMDLKYDVDKLDVFLENIGMLKDKLGPLLLQFPPYLKPDLEKLADLFDDLKNRYIYAVEFRNHGRIEKEIISMLIDRGISLVATNKTGSPFEVTTCFLYIRWEGDRRIVHGEKGEVELDKSMEVSEWVQKINPILDKGIPIYGYFSKYYTGYPPADVMALRSALTR